MYVAQAINMNNGEQCKTQGIKVPKYGYKKVPVVGVKRMNVLNNSI